jgi:hypothetical protein
MPINKAEETTVAFEQSKADLANKLLENDPNLSPGSALNQAGVALEGFDNYATDSLKTLCCTWI